MYSSWLRLSLQSFGSFVVVFSVLIFSLVLSMAKSAQDSKRLKIARFPEKQRYEAQTSHVVLQIQKLDTFKTRQMTKRIENGFDAEEPASDDDSKASEDDESELTGYEKAYRDAQRQPYRIAKCHLRHGSIPSPRLY